MAYEDKDSGFQIYMRQIAEYPLLTPEQEIELANQIKEGNENARQTMIRSNLRLVVKIARDYTNLGLPLLDIISEGNIGLVHAVEHFNPLKGSKFSTYGALWIKQSIRRALSTKSKTIRIPAHLADKIARINRIAASLSNELGRDATDEEIAEEVGMTAEKVTQLQESAIRPSSLNAPIGEGDCTELGELVGDVTAIDPYESLNNKSMQLEIEEHLHQLDDRELQIINARFGLNGSEPMTLEEIGEKLGLTRERIRQVQNTALQKIRNSLNKRSNYLK